MAKASGTCGARLTWSLGSDGVLDIEGKGKMNSYSSRRAPWYSRRNDISGVQMGDGVESIGAEAFSGCSSLENVFVSAKVSEVPESCFSGCTSLSAVTFGEGSQLSSVYGSSSSSYGAFHGVPSTCDFYVSTKTAHDALESYGIGDDHLRGTLVDLASGVRYWVSGSTAIVSGSIGGGALSIPATVGSGLAVKAVAPRAFYKDATISSLTVSSSVESIGERAFFGCSSLASVSFANDSTLSQIGESAFNRCTSLTSLSLPASLKTLGAYTFYGCSVLEDAHISAGIDSLPDECFAGCDSLKSVSFAEGSALSSVYGSVSSSYGAFNEAPASCIYYVPAKAVRDALSSYGIGDDNLRGALVDEASGVRYWTSGTSAVVSGAVHGGDLAIPESVGDGLSVTGIASRAFRMDESITSVAVPASVESIGERAFSGCTSLASVTFAEGSKLSKVGEAAFHSCTSLDRLDFPSSLVKVDGYAFYGCTGLSSVTIPAPKADVASGAFESAAPGMVVYVGNADLRSTLLVGNPKLSVVVMQDGKKPVTGLKIEVSKDPALVYDGNPKTPDVAVSEGGRKLSAGADYTVSYSDNVNAGRATVTVSGAGEYCSTKTGSFTIAAAKIAASQAAAGLVYNGAEQTGVASGAYYTVTDGTATNAGEYKARLLSDANHDWSNGTKLVTIKWKIARAKVEVPLGAEGLVYNGKEQTGVADGEGYSVSGGTETNAGSYIARVTPDRNHAWPDGSTGSKSISWSIARKKIDPPEAVGGLDYNGKEQTGVADGEGYRVVNNTASAIGKYTARVSLDPNYEWTDGTTDAKSIAWQIHGRRVAVPKPATGLVYNGREQTGVRTGDGYTIVQFASGTDARKYTCVLSLKPGFEWEDGSLSDKSVAWSIARATVNESALQRSFTYNGESQMPDFESAHVSPDEDWDDDSGSTNAGTYSVSVTPDENYQWADGSTGARTITWSIAKKQVAIPTAAPRLKYNGKRQKGVAATSGCAVYGGSSKTGGRHRATACLKNGKWIEKHDEDWDGDYADNYVWADGSTGDKSIPWTLTQVVIGDDGSVVYGTKKLQVTVRGACKGDRLTVKIGKKSYTRKVKKDADSAKFTFKRKVKAGTKVKAALKDSKKKKVTSASAKVSQNRASVSVSNVYQVSGKLHVTVKPALSGDRVKVKVGGRTYSKRVKKASKKKKLTFRLGHPKTGKKVKVTVYNKDGQKRGSGNTKVYYASAPKMGMTKWQVRHCPDCGSPDSTNNGTVGWYSYDNYDGTLWLTVYFTYGRVSQIVYW